MERIYYNGDILTLRKEDEKVEALAVVDGKIGMSGAYVDIVKQFPNAEIYDLKGNTLMPAFIDAHSHISKEIEMQCRVNLGDCEDLDSIVEKLKEFVKKNNITKEDFVIGYNYDHNFLPEGKHPTKECLNKVSIDIPIVIYHTSLHMCVVNDAVIKILGITVEDNNPAGGIYGKTKDGKELTGYLEETGMNNLRKILNNGRKFDIDKCAEGAQLLYLKNGITTVQDGYATINDIEFMRNITNKDTWKLDVVSYVGIEQDSEVVKSKYKSILKKYENKFKLGGYKLVLDGSPQGKSAFLSKPYENSGDYRAYSRFTDEEVDDYCEKAVNDDMQVLVHCNGDAAGDQFLNSYNKAINKSTNKNKYNLRPVKIHCQTTRLDQLDKMSQLNIIASIFVGHVYYWGDVHVKNLGIERGTHVSPVKSALKRGLSVNFHQDTPVTEPKMFHSIWVATNRKTRNGVVIGKEECCTVYEALRAVTIDAAYEYFEENSKGTLEKGKIADMIIVDQNPMKIDKSRLKDIKVLQTVKSGNVVYSL